MAWFWWHLNVGTSSCFAAMGMYTWTVWAASRIRSQCVPLMTPTRRPDKAWHRQRRRLGAGVPLSLRLEAAIWVSGKQLAGAGASSCSVLGRVVSVHLLQRKVHVRGCCRLGTVATGAR